MGDDDAYRVGGGRREPLFEVAELLAADRCHATSRDPSADAARCVETGEGNAAELEERLELVRDVAAVLAIGIEEALDEIDRRDVMIARDGKDRSRDGVEEGARRGELAAGADLGKVSADDYEVGMLRAELVGETRSELVRRGGRSAGLRGGRDASGSLVSGSRCGFSCGFLDGRRREH